MCNFTAHGDTGTCCKSDHMKAPTDQEQSMLKGMGPISELSPYVCKYLKFYVLHIAVITRPVYFKFYFEEVK